jgi:intron-binding protein aquarius
VVDTDDPWAADRAFVTEVLLRTYERRKFQTEVINEMPLYPTEAVLWDENQVPSVHYTGALEEKFPPPSPSHPSCCSPP